MIHNDQSPFGFLIKEKKLRPGQALYFRYTCSNGEDHNFTGIVQKDGIQVDGLTHNASYAAVRCIRKTGDKKAVNGFFTWETEEGWSLADLYQICIGQEIEKGTHQNNIEKYYKYPEQRDVVFVFGAGASYADGAPLQKDLLPLILSNLELHNSVIYKIIHTFLVDNFVWDDQSAYYPTLEQVFGFLDYFLQKNESLNRVYSLENMRIIRECLIQAIHHIITTKTEAKSEVYASFWNAVANYNSNISAITLNYDTYLEDAFATLYPFNMYLDYCMHLANYDYSDEVDEANWWVNPREPILTTESVVPKSFKIIKVHGSLNWRYCNCCNTVLLTPLDKKIFLEKGEIPWAQDHATTSRSYYPQIGRTCSRDGNALQTLLVPPSHLKDLSHPIISQLFIEASSEIRRANKVVFVGYSLPEADVHIKAILKKSLKPDTEVIIVDINNRQDFILRCRELTTRVSFIHEPFKNLLDNEGLMEQVLT